MNSATLAQCPGCTFEVDERKPETASILMQTSMTERIRAMLDRYLRLLEAVALDPIGLSEAF
jgi:hypothetical protein